MNEISLQKIIDNTVNELYRPNNDMTLFAAQQLAKKIQQKASEMGVKPVIAITNKGANPVLVECADDSFIASYDIALNKAFTSVSLKMSTKELANLAKPSGSLYGIQFTNNGRIVIFGGGVTLTNSKGDIIGGLGVSGGTEG